MIKVNSIKEKNKTNHLKIINIDIEFNKPFDVPQKRGPNLY